jgi:putative cardiolipin synthase
VDGAKVFVGSFNFDPRSARLNTEMGFLVDSPGMARRMAEVFDTEVPRNAYQPQLDAEGRLVWLEPKGACVLRHQQEPGASWWRRTQILLISPLPIESLL